MQHAFDLSGRVALVTGGSRGLGKAICAGLGKLGAAVALNYFNNSAKAEETLASLRQQGIRAGTFRGDASCADDVARNFEEIAAQLGPVDIVVVNATPDQPELPIEEYTWDHYQRMLDFFVKSPYLLARSALPHMKQQGWGRIINIGSEVYQRGVPNFSAYVAAKGAQAGWTRSMASELAKWNITVNLVAPGWIPVERHESYPAAQKAGYKALIPMQRWGQPDDVAGAVCYFASEAASFVTGQCVCVNGGMTPMA